MRYTLYLHYFQSNVIFVRWREILRLSST